MDGTARAAVIVLLASFALAACAGGDDADADATSGAAVTTTGAVDDGSALRLTLTDDGCTYEGGQSQASGRFTVDVENQSTNYGAFEIGGLAKGSTLADLETHIAEEQQRWDETQQLRGPPPFYVQAVRVGVDPGATSQLPVDVAPGTYALTCFNDDLPVWKAYVASQVDVTG